MVQRSTLILLALCLSLTGCSSSSNTASQPLTDTVVAKRVPVQVAVPKTWRQISDDALEKVGPNVVLAFSDDSVDGRGVRNLSVVEERLERPLSSLQYAYANASLAAKNLEDYVKVQETDVTIKDANNTDIKTRWHLFEARFDRKNPKRKYLQLYATQGYYGYTFTIQTVLDDLGLPQLEKLLTSFRFVK